MLIHKRFMTYVVSVLSVAAALALRMFWGPVLKNDSPFLFFFAATVLASWYGGLWPGIFATLLSAYGVAVLNLLPIYPASGFDISHLLQYAVFITIGCLASYLMGQFHSAIDRLAKAEHDQETRVGERTAELMEANGTLHRLSSELLTVQERERLRISKELHDELGQSLTLIKMKVGLIETNLPESLPLIKKCCADASAHVDQAVENMRRLSHDLSPVMVETLGITIAVRLLVQEFRAAAAINITATIDPIDDLLSLHSSILLYRIVQEGLNNIVKHSGASAADLSIRKHEDLIRFELKDNGCGIDLQGQKPSVTPGSGLGLVIMKERVRTLGGALAVESRNGSGTMLNFSVKGPTPAVPTQEAAANSLE